MKISDRREFEQWATREDIRLKAAVDCAIDLEPNYGNDRVKESDCGSGLRSASGATVERE